jgi:hypothetical protein
MDLARDQLVKRLTEYQQAAEEHHKLSWMNEGAAQAIQELIQEIDNSAAQDTSEQSEENHES